MTRSEELFARARTLIPGGVDSPVRAFGAVGGTPGFAARGEGAYGIDADGGGASTSCNRGGVAVRARSRGDRAGGHRRAAARGTSFGAPTEAEVELAARIVEALPGVDMVRLVSSGTEATMSAIGSRAAPPAASGS